MSRNSHMTDEELVTLCCKQDRKAQELFFKLFSSKMLGVCSRYADSLEEAEDILQEGFIKIFQKMDSFKGQGSLEGWIKRIMINTALDSFRKNKNLRYQIDIETIEYSASESPHVLGAMGAKELLKLIKTMPAGFRTVFNLYAIEGYSHKEIGDLLGITESTSKSQYSRARAFLQKLLQTEKAI